MVLYKVLEHAPLDTVSNSAVELLTQPLAAEHVVPCLRDRYRTHLGDRSRYDCASEKHRHHGEL